MDYDLSPKASEIVASTRTCLAAGGYNGFSYADLSTAVGITKASIHHHFPTKAELVRVTLQLYRQAARNGLAALSSAVPEPAAQLQAYADHWMVCIRDNTSPFCVCAMLAAEMPSLPVEVAEEVKSFFRDLAAWLASVLAKGAADGSFRLAASPEMEAEALMAAVHGAMLSARAYGGDADMFGMVVRASLQRLTHA